MKELNLSEFEYKILSDKISKGLLLICLMKKGKNKRNLLDIIFPSPRDSYKKMSPFYDTEKAIPYFLEALKRRLDESMSSEEESYISNNSWQKIANDYVKNKIKF